MRTSLLPRASLLPIALLTATATAQTGPHIGYVYPAGGQRGTSFEVIVGGQRLRGLADAFVSSAGVRAKVKSYEPLLPQREVNALREEAGKLAQKRRKAQQKWTAADQRRLTEIQRKLADRNRRRQIPAIAEIAVLQVTIAPNTPPGNHDLRLITAIGPTNPVVFCVGELREFSERFSHPRRGRGRRGRSRTGRASRAQTAGETRIEIPAIANGRILPGQADRFRFHATKGQRIVASVAARELIPYLADAVPGWFQAVIALRDGQGKEIAHVDDYRFHPDPVLVCDVPADGDYVLEIRDALYRGREDFVYRIAVGELPFVTSIFPLGAPVDTATQVELHGYNLRATHVALPGQGIAGVAMLRASGNQLTSNALPFQRDTLRESLEQEPNDNPVKAQHVEIPLIINGRIGDAGDVDVFCFEGRYGQEFVAEVEARRLQSPVDSVLRLTDASGRQVAFSDDLPDLAQGRMTHHADSYVRVKLPRTGTYYVRLADAQRQGGPEYGYRLRLGSPRANFDLRILPSCILTRAGATVAFTVRAVRRDGFEGPIALSLDGAPKGFELHGAVIPTGEDTVRVTMTVPIGSPSAALDQPIGVRIVGRAHAGSRQVVRPAAAADDVMQAFLYRHLVTTEGLLVSIRGRTGLPIRTTHDKTVALPLGGTARLKLALKSRWALRWVVKNHARLALDTPPPGIAIQKVTQSDGGFEVVLRTDSKKVKPGSAGNLIFSVFATPKQQPKRRGAPKRGRRHRALGILPAVPYRIAKTKERAL